MRRGGLDRLSDRITRRVQNAVLLIGGAGSGGRVLDLGMALVLCMAGGVAGQDLGRSPESPSEVGVAPNPTILLSPPEAAALFDRLGSEPPAAVDVRLTFDSPVKPHDPFVLLARMKSSWWQILEGRDADGHLAVRMREDLSLLEDRLEGRLVTASPDPQAAWLLGEAHCTLGRLDALQGRTWSAFRHHQRGIGLLEEVRRQVPEAPEPRASLGLFHYYAARLPRSLRILGRIAGLRGDRPGGLEDLRAAASVPGLQQHEAQFFLVQVLQHEEGETFEALAIARVAHARAPRHLGFALELADVLVGMRRPDAALDVVAALDTTDACARAQSALLRARIDVDSGRPAAALGVLQQLDDGDRRSVSWLEPWLAIVRGRSLAALGHRTAARAALETALRTADAAGSKEAAAAALESVGDPLAVARVRAESILTWGGDPGTARQLLEEARTANPRQRADTAFLLAMGRAALRQGDARAALAPLRRAVEQGGGDDVGLVVEPRIRLLQALLWSGEIDRARERATEEASQLGRWGTNQHLAALVQGILQPPGLAPSLRIEPAASGGEPFRLVDLGFTSVDLLVRTAAGSVQRPMAWGQGAWITDCSLPPGVHHYVFVVEGRERVLDPGSSRVVVRDGVPWNVRHVGSGS